MAEETTWVPWRAATEAALYGPAGFYRRHRPASQFRTSVHASPLLAQALADLARTAALPTVVDVGAGGGELLADLHRWAPELSLVGVDVGERPPGLPPAIAWTTQAPDDVEGLLVAHELRDDVPVDVVVHDGRDWRLLLVDIVTGEERVSGPVGTDDRSWLAAWWPASGRPGQRAEVGWPRDDCWAELVGSLRRGIAVAVDYAHTRDDRPATGTLTGYRDGRQVAPVPDSSCDVTSHVALDACAAAGRRAGATATVLTTQQEALAALGSHAPRPPHDLARSNPAGYVRALSARGELAELTDPAGLGAFGWLVQAVGIELPEQLRGLQQATGTEL
jgi:SAM-dependent MidA family methyltransferase